MNDDTTWQIVEHTYAVAIWTLKYIKKHNLPVAKDETWPSFKFHMGRLQALIQGLDASLACNPVISDAILQGKPSDKDYTEPGSGRFCRLGAGSGNLLSGRLGC